MAKVIFREKAIDDLSNIWNYTTFRWSENQADKYYEAIKSACKEIGTNPNLGKKYFEISRELFGFKTGKHIIFYHAISNNEIEVIRILHEQINLKNRLKE